jgi:hypothetical protein
MFSPSTAARSTSLTRLATGAELNLRQTAARVSEVVPEGEKATLTCVGPHEIWSAGSGIGTVVPVARPEAEFPPVEAATD